MKSATVRHMDDFTKLRPEALAKLSLMIRTRGIGNIARLLHTSVVTLEGISSPLGGCRKRTIVRIEEALAKIPAE